MEKKPTIMIKYGDAGVDIKYVWFLFVVFDFLFLPYIRALQCSMGMLVVGVWFVFNFMKAGREDIWLIIGLVLLSNINGIFTRSIGTHGMTQAIMFVYAFLLLQFSEDNIPQKTDIVKKLFVIYILFTTSLAMIYAASPQEYFSLRSTWTMNNTQIEFTSMSINRFTSVFSDPNNCGTSLIAVLCYLLVYENVSVFTLAVISVCTFICIVLTYSVTALVLFIAAILFYLLLGNRTEEQKKKRATLIFIVVLALIIFAEFISAVSSGTSSNQFVRTLQKRIEWNTGNNNLGGRVPRWIAMLTSLPPQEYVIAGKGLVLDERGRLFQAHNGILYVFYSYGLPAVFIYLKRFYSFAQRKLIYLLPAIVIFIAVFINEGFNDYRFLTLSTFILALTKVKGKQLKQTD